MNKLQIMAKSAMFGKRFNSQPSEPIGVYTESFIDGFKSCINTLNEKIELEQKQLKLYDCLGERHFALKMYQDTMNEMLKKLEENES